MSKKTTQLIGQIIGNYRLLDVLGEGGMGAVYKAEHTLIGKKVALKMLHAEYSERPEIVQRFFTEAKAVNKIGHRNIVDISDYGQSEDGRPYFIMEHLEGTELSKEIEKKGAMELKRSLHIFRQIASALEASHKAGIIHRDLKPENIFLIPLDDRDFVKVLDFGIAKLTEGDRAQNSKTKTGMIVGTPAYMAPEQAEGLTVDHRTDIYAMGIILYEMLTGEQPFAADTFSRVLIKVLTEPVPPPRVKNPNIPPAIEAFILKMVEKLPGNRFQSIPEILATLKDAEANIMPAGLSAAPAPVRKNLTTLTGMNGEVSKKQAPSSKRGVFLGGAAVVALSSGIVAFLMLNQEPAPPAPAPLNAAAQPVASAPVQAPAEITLEINTKPDGAKIIEGGKELGVTPFQLKTPRSDAPRTFEISKEGFASQTLTLTPNNNNTNNLILEKAPAIAKADPKPTKATKTVKEKPPEKAPEKTEPKKGHDPIDSTVTIPLKF